MRPWRNLQPFPSLGIPRRDSWWLLPHMGHGREGEGGRGAGLECQAGCGCELPSILSESLMCPPATGCQGLHHPLGPRGLAIAEGAHPEKAPDPVFSLSLLRREP